MAIFKLLTPLLHIQRWDLELANPDVLKDNNTAANEGVLENGMWMALNDSYLADVFEHGACCTVKDGSGQTLAGFQVYAEAGRTDTQSIGKAPFLWTQPYEGETDQFVDDPTALPDGQGDIGARPAWAVGIPITVVPSGYKDTGDADEDHDLPGILCTADTTTDMVYGYVTKIPANNNGMLRFIISK